MAIPVMKSTVGTQSAAPAAQKSAPVLVTPSKTVVTTPAAITRQVEAVSSAPTTPTVSVPLESRDAYIQWRSNMDKKVYTGTVSDIRAPADLWQRFLNARRRITLLMQAVGVVASSGIAEVLNQWWPHWDPDGAAAFDNRVTPGAPPRYGTIYAPQFVRGPQSIVDFVKLQAQRYGATDAVVYEPGAGVVAEVCGYNLLTAAGSAGPGAGGGGMVSSFVTGTEVQSCGAAPRCPDGSCARLLIGGTGPSPWLCPGNVYVDSSGAVVTGTVSPAVPPPPAAVTYGEPTAGAGLFTPRNLLIGGGILGLLWWLFKGGKKRKR